MADKQLELIEKPLHARAVEIARENVVLTMLPLSSSWLKRLHTKEVMTKS
jgi:hypothetical protein